MASVCSRGYVRSRGRCVKPCRPGHSRSRKTNRCKKKPTARPRRTLRRAQRRRSGPPSAPRKTARPARGRVAAGNTARKSTTAAKTRRTRAAVKRINDTYRLLTGSHGKIAKVSARGNVRPSAAEARRNGAAWGTVVCYDGTCKRLREDKNKRAYWGA